MTSSALSYANDEDPLIRRLAIGGVEALFGRRAIEAVYEKWRTDDYGSSDRVFGRLLEMYGIDLHFKGRWPVEQIPDGPVLMVSNHPFGVADGMALGAIAELFGRPYKVLVNERMMKVPEFRPYILPISFDETPEAMRLNLDSRNEAMKMLGDGATVGIFPAGSVATAPRGFGPAEELPWKLFVPKLAQVGKANILPIYMEGQNSLLFQLISRASLTVRRALLFREFRNQFGKPITINIGDILPWSEISRISDRRSQLDYIRQAVHAMQPHDPRRMSRLAQKALLSHPIWREDAMLMRGGMKVLRRDGTASPPAIRTSASVALAGAVRGQEVELHQGAFERKVAVVHQEIA